MRLLEHNFQIDRTMARRVLGGGPAFAAYDPVNAEFLASFEGSIDQSTSYTERGKYRELTFSGASKLRTLSSAFGSNRLAVAADGDRAYVDGFPKIGTDPFVLSTWVFKGADSDHFRFVMGTYDQGSGESGWMMYITDSAATPADSVRMRFTKDGGTEVNLSSDTGVVSGTFQWQQIVVQRDANNLWQMWIGDQSAGTLTRVYRSQRDAEDIDAGTRFALGDRAAGTGIWGLEGAVDETLVYLGSALYDDVATIPEQTALWDRPAQEAFRYWRISIPANQGGSYVYGDEVELRESIGGADVTGPGIGIVSASSEFSAAYSADRLFDNGTLGSYFSTGGNPTYPVTVDYDFGAGNEKAIVEMSFDASTGNYPDRFSIQRSSDGTNWVEEWSTGSVTWGPGPQVFSDPE